MSRTPISRRLGRAAVLALALATAAPARADDATEQARTRFARGVELYKESDFRGAIIEFQRAYELVPNYRIHYNLGQTYVELLDYASALKAFESYLAEGGGEIAADRRAEVERELQKLQSRVGKLTVTSPVVGAAVTIDDVLVGTTPLAAPLLVSAGRRRVVLSKNGYTSSSRVVDVAGGDGLSVSVDLSPVVAPDRRPPPSLPQRPSDSGLGTPFWVGVVTTGALAAGAAVVGIVTVMARSSHDEEVERLGVSRSELADSRDDVVALAIATDILAGTAIVAGSVTLVLGLTSTPDAAPAPPSSKRSRAWGPTLRGSF